ncbi:HDOD domain-containing protein [Ectothiorhodospiraceae bacterium BW-2]|nr:HDOD domain-containing protein [Ectothiorhodospiraceae bacterium BW-2]
MNATLIKWVNSLQSIELPAITHNIKVLKNLIVRETIPMDQVDRVLEKDIGLALRLIRQLNKIQHQHGRDDIDSIPQARMFSGLDKLSLLPQKLPSLEKCDNRVVLNYLTILKRYYHAAVQARQWAIRRQDPDPNAIFLATLLHCVGELALWIKVPEKMVNIQKRIVTNDTEPEEAQYLELGFLIDEFTKELAKVWHLPIIFQRSLYPENASDSRIYTIMLAIELSHSGEVDWYSPETREIETRLAKLMRLETGETVAMIHTTAAIAAIESNYIRLPHAANRLLLPAYPIATEETNDSEETQSSRQVSFCLAPRRPLLLRYLKQLKQHRGERLFKEIIQSAMLAMHDGLGLNRVVYGVVTSDHYIKARSIVGSDDPDFNRFSIELPPKSFFRQVLQRPVPIWLNQNNYARYWPRIPPKFRQKLEVKSFYVMALYVNDKLCGVFYADRANPHCHLDERSFKLFKRVVAETANALERGYRKVQ